MNNLSDDVRYQAVVLHHNAAEAHSQRYAQLGLGALMAVHYLRGNNLGLILALLAVLAGFTVWRCVVEGIGHPAAARVVSIMSIVGFSLACMSTLVLVW